MIKNIILDFDGTLVRSKEYYNLYSRYLEEVAENFFKNREKALLLLNKYRKKYSGAGELIINDYPKIGEFWYNKIIKINPKEYFDADNELIAFLGDLKNYKLFIYSNSPTAQIKKILKSKEVSFKTFKKILGWTFKKPLPKPNIENLKKFLEQEKIKRDTCIFIGDSLFIDIKDAKILGLKPIHYKNTMTLKDLTKLIKSSTV